MNEVAPCDGIRIRWADLYRECRQPAGCALRYHAEVRNVKQAPDGRLRLRVVHAGGRREEIAGIDLLIAPTAATLGCAGNCAAPRP